MEYSYEFAMQYGKVFISENKLACALILYPKKKKFKLKIIFLDINLLFICIGLTRIGKVVKKEKKN